ncbi:hypothetical protein CYMTET_28218, partial [Cymbomonas tetramitiformis]
DDAERRKKQHAAALARIKELESMQRKMEEEMAKMKREAMDGGSKKGTGNGGENDDGDADADAAFAASGRAASSKAAAILDADPKEALNALLALDPAEAARLLALMPTAEAAALLAKMSNKDAAKIIAGMDPADAARLLACMDPNKAASIMQTPPMNPAKAAEMLALMTPPEAARIIQKMEINFAAQTCMKFTVDFCSSVFSCGVLTTTEVADLIITMNNDEFSGTVLFAMKRKTDDNFIGPMLDNMTAQQEGMLITSMTNQALKRLGISTLKGQRLREVLEYTGFSESCEFIECMPPQSVAEMMMEHMEVGEAATQLKMISGEARSHILQAGTAEWRELIEGSMDMADAGSAAFICPKCGYMSPNTMSLSEQAAHLANMAPEDAAKLLMDLMDTMDPEDFARLLLSLDPPMQGEQASDVLCEMIFAGKGEKIKKDIHPAMGNIDAPKTKLIFDLLEDKKKTRKKKGKGQGAVVASAFDQNFMEMDCVSVDGDDGKELPPITPPESWLTFLGTPPSREVAPAVNPKAAMGASNMAEMQKMWKKDGNKTIQVTKLRSLVVKIYQAKIEADINNMRAGKFRYPLVDYVVMYFDTFFGLKQARRPAQAPHP